VLYSHEIAAQRMMNRWFAAFPARAVGCGSGQWNIREVLTVGLPALAFSIGLFLTPETSSVLPED